MLDHLNAEAPKRREDPALREICDRLSRLEKDPHRRRDDPVIKAVHERLNRLEELSADMKEIKEWISTVVKVTHAFEALVKFFGSAAWLAAKVSAALFFVWMASKSSVVEALTTVRDFWRAGK
jgi:hypothetical protein